MRVKHNFKSVLVEKKANSKAYQKIGGATFYYETMQDGRQRMTAQGPIIDKLEAVVSIFMTD